MTSMSGHGGLADMQLDVDFWFEQELPWNIEQTVIIDVERRAPVGP